MNTKVMRPISFDEAFKPSADDIARGDGYSKKAIEFKDHPEFGRTTVTKNVTNISDFIKEQAQAFIQRYNEEGMNPQLCNLGNDHFEYIRPLGSGSFANVALVKRKITGIYYARKTISKHFLITTKRINEAKNEKRILSALRFPFTVHLKCFYQDNFSIYFVLPVLGGGQLFNYLVENRRVRERLAKFIASHILLALEYLHFIGIIHRDLKLENILIDHYGYIKVSDFGTSKLIYSKRTYTICGTAEYMAPEMITQKGYGLAADWWSFGVLVYELCNGTPPFFADETIQVFTLIARCDYDMPVHFSNALSSLIQNLLQLDVTKRIGNLQNGINEIKHQIWFREVPWLAIVNLRIISPMIPSIAESFYEHTTEPTALLPEKSDLYGKEFENF